MRPSFTPIRALTTIGDRRIPTKEGAGVSEHVGKIKQQVKFTEAPVILAFCLDTRRSCSGYALGGFQRYPL